mmetsp:Transcript_69994/g.216420  ORF Transcript_69994/g.216420 Transcript_69994/m.216420 type:complete len:142 (-) Transcript_69994:171-596(-)
MHDEGDLIPRPGAPPDMGSIDAAFNSGAFSRMSATAAQVRSADSDRMCQQARMEFGRELRYFQALAVSIENAWLQNGPSLEEAELAEAGLGLSVEQAVQLMGEPARCGQVKRHLELEFVRELEYLKMLISCMEQSLAQLEK